MPEFIADCPRCNARHVTFDLQATNDLHMNHGWQRVREAYSICRACHCGTVFFVADKGIDQAGYLHENGFADVKSVGDLVVVKGHLSSANFSAQEPPDSLPNDIRSAFEEGAKCVAVGCYNAAGTMFRLCLDLATRGLLPEEDVDGLNPRIRGSLGLTLGWLFQTSRLPIDFRNLADCVKDDGNDGAHAGTLNQEEADDLQDFAFALLDRLYSEPARLASAKARRDARRRRTAQQ
ncbi:DUF4145 domain-containing protein [Ralstonia solanacearum]|uniref:DUF4145 domain-containing protein n=1 Tax=Ralstonia solanacearum TaxID=305 RepID=UPI000AB52324|nr:DUF4145 domain-containing protein [Ralstonia solanacearum]